MVGAGVVPDADLSALDAPAVLLYQGSSSGIPSMGRRLGARRAEAKSRWPTTFPEARELQESLRKRVRLMPLRTRLRRVAGCDVSEERAAAIFAAVVSVWPEPIGSRPRP
jgi:hypothetical protein